jgi:hypothetical protein
MLVVAEREKRIRESDIREISFGNLVILNGKIRDAWLDFCMDGYRPLPLVTRIHHICMVA